MINGAASLGSVAASASQSVPDVRAKAIDALAGVVSAMADWSARLSGGDDTGIGMALDRLRHGGDIYGLRDIASTLAQTLQATPAEEGRLLRALEEVVRQSAVRIFGLAGASDAARVADLQAAITTAGTLADSAANSAQDVIGWLETVAAELEASAARG